MNLDLILTEIRDFLSQNADETIVQKYARYFKEGYEGYGIPVEIFNAKKEEWLAKYQAELGLTGFLELGDMLFDSGKYEEGALAIHFIMAFQKQFDMNIFDHIGKWLETGVHNWAHTDIISGETLGYFIKNGIVTLQDFSNWRVSPSKWRRRSVPVSMLNFLKIQTDYTDLLDFIRPMMMESERVVHQGLGWFLREAWKKQPGPVEKFLLEYKDSAARLIYQYATEKMSKEQKESFRAEKKSKVKK